MIDAVVGSVIMVVATTSLVLAVEVSEKAFRQSGYQPLSQQEERLVDSIPPPFPHSKSFQSSNVNLFRSK